MFVLINFIYCLCAPFLFRDTNYFVIGFSVLRRKPIDIFKRILREERITLIGCLIEEIMFRGFLLLYVNVYTLTWSTVIFGLQHYEPIFDCTSNIKRIFNTLILGIIWTQILLLHKSMLMVLTFHLLYNLYQMSLSKGSTIYSEEVYQNYINNRNKQFIK